MKKTASLMRCRFLVVFVLLLLLPSCTKDEPWKWVPDTAGGDIEPYDSGTDMSYEEYLMSVDTPIVVEVRPGYIYSRPCISTADYAFLWDAPHVTNVFFPTLIHWMGSEKSGYTVLIGQYPKALDGEALAEGRWYASMDECCVNRAEYDRLLNDAESGFSGLGDSIPVTQSVYNYAYSEAQGKWVPTTVRGTVSQELTVVGIVEDEGIYADEEAFETHHVFVHTDMLTRLVGMYPSQSENELDNDRFLINRIIRDLAIESGAVCWQGSIEDPASIRYRLVGNQTLSIAEWDAHLEGIPINAGYTVEVTLDSGKNYAEFAQYMFERRFTDRTAEESYQALWENYLQSMEEHPESEAVFSAAPVTVELHENGESNDWYMCGGCHYVRPLRIAGE